MNINNVAAISSFIYYFYRKDKELKIKEVDDFHPYFYVSDEEGEYTSIYGEKVRKIVCEEPYDVYKQRRFYGKTFEADIHYPNRFIIDRVDEIESSSIRKRFLDIETFFDGGKINVLNPEAPILSNTVYDSFDNEYHVFVWHDRIKNISLELPNTKIHLFDNEKDMLEEWMIWERKNVADIWWGWYAEKFDYPYLYNRIGSDFFKFMSPIEYCTFDERYGVNLAGICLADLLAHYKKLTGFLHGERRSYSLDYIGKIELGEGKESNLSPLEISQMWREDVESFIKYNHKDVELMVGIENKYHITEYIDALRKISHSTFDDTLSYATMVDNSLLYLARKDKIVLPTKQKVVDEKKKGPEVFEVEPGLYKNVIMLDLKSLYPNIIMSLNLSPETQSEDGEIVVDGKRFKKEPLGLFPRALGGFQEERDDEKNKMFAVEEGSDEYVEYDMKQRALKARNNSLIGYLGYNNSRFYSKDIFETVTGVAKEVQNDTKEMLEKDGHAKVIMGDTDALDLVLNKKCDDYIVMGKKLEKLVNENLDDIVKKFNITEHSLEYKFEKFFETLLIFTKKRYVGKLVWREGDEMNKIEDVGVDTRRSNTPEVVKNIQMELFKKVLNDCSKEELDCRVEEIWKEYEQMRLEDIAFISSFNKPMEEYKSNSIHIRAIKNSMEIGLDFNVGEKIKWLYIEDKDYDVLAFREIDSYIKKIKEYKINWRAMKERLKKKINMIYEAIGWDFPEHIDGTVNGKQHTLF